MWIYRLFAPKGFQQSTRPLASTTSDGGGGAAKTAATSTARIEDIFVSPEPAAPMKPLETATLITGVGIEGDRYALRRGTYSADFLDEPGKHLTLVSSDAVEGAIAGAGMEPFEYRTKLRRNIVVGGVSAEALNAMVGHEVALGGCRLFVHRRTVPCKYREAQCERPGLMNGMWEACGVSCEIIEGGTISVGDELAVVPGAFRPEKVDVGLKPPGFFVRPAERTAEMVKADIAPPHAAALVAFLDPVGFLRVERGYNSAGQHFWSPRAYRAGSVAMKARTPVAVAVGIAFLSVVIASVLR